MASRASRLSGGGCAVLKTNGFLMIFNDRWTDGQTFREMRGNICWLKKMVIAQHLVKCEGSTYCIDGLHTAAEVC